MENFEEIKLKNVLLNDRTKKDITVKVIPFDSYNEQHIEFAFAHSDMLFRAPSAFANISEASKAYVKEFVVHTEEQEKATDSEFTAVVNDLRACRTVFHQDAIQKALNDFFENA